MHTDRSLRTGNELHVVCIARSRITIQSSQLVLTLEKEAPLVRVGYDAGCLSVLVSGTSPDTTPVALITITPPALLVGTQPLSGIE